MTNNKLLKIGSVGTVVAAVCCFTPVLVVLLAAVGLSAWGSAGSTMSCFQRSVCSS